jgi:sugar/nucleoside kinase (ribokinase family)
MSGVGLGCAPRPCHDRSVTICSLGDLLLDVVVRLREPLPRDGEAGAVTRVGAGGQAANVAAWASELGAEARFVGKRANDAAGRLVADEVEGRGVELLGPVVDGGTGVVVSLAEPGGLRSMASDRGVAPDLRAEELEIAWFRGCEVLHLSGYSLFRSPIDQAGAKAAGAVRQQGGRISVDLSSAEAILAFGAERFRDRLGQLQPDVIFATEVEIDALGGDIPAPVLVRKRGARGIAVETGGRATELAAEVVEAVDSTGAGDALAAGFLVGGPELGLAAAARCVAKLGAMP